MNLLLHICCGPCAIAPVAMLREQNNEVSGFFYNPNIHPYQEFKRRLDALEKYSQAVNLKISYNKNYDLENFLRQVVYREQQRCIYCYRTRLEKTATAAREGGFEAFSTTLLVSPYQKHDLIRETGEQVARDTGIPFYYQDFRPRYREGVAKSREMELYRQPYCGCIFSEKERYQPKGVDDSR